MVYHLLFCARRIHFDPPAQRGETYGMVSAQKAAVEARWGDQLGNDTEKAVDFKC